MAQWDNEVIDRLAGEAQEGDREAFSKIVRLMMQPIVALTYKMTGDREAAKDLAQDTFVAAWSNLADFRGDARFSSWLYRIASNKSLNYLGSAAVRDSQPFDETIEDQTASPDTEHNPEKSLVRHELKEKFMEFLTTLPPKQRLAFELRFYKELPFEEIARVTNSALGTVKTNYRQAVAKLKEYALERGWQ